MPKLRRLEFRFPPGSGGGGGNPIVGNVAWGPDFGEANGSDDVTWRVGVNMDLDSIALENTRTVGVSQTFDALALENTRTVGVHLSGEVSGAPFWQSVATAVHTSAGSDITVSKPSGVVPGNLMLALIGTSAAVGSPDINTPSGWTLIRHDTVGAVVAHATSFYKIAVGTTPDTSGNSRHATLIGTILPQLVSSPFSGGGNVLRFEGVDRDDNTSGLSREPTDLGAATADGTMEVECEIWPTRSGTAEVYIAKWNGATSTRNYILFKDASDKLNFGVRSSGGVDVTAVGTTSLTVGQAWTVKGRWTGTVLEVYVNGVTEGTTPAITALQAPDGVTNLTIGRSLQTGGGAPFPFEGYMRNAKVTIGGTVRGLWAMSSVTDTEPSSYTFTFTASADQATAEIHRIIGTDYAQPINVSAGATGLATGLDPDPSAPAVTTTVTNTLIFAWLFHSHLLLTQSHTAPASHEERTDLESNVLGTIYGSTSATRIFAATGSQAAVEFNCTETVATDFITQRIAIAPGPVLIAP